MTIHVVRYSFFRTREGTLRFTEHSPHHVEKEGHLCNCTRQVNERPSGEPDEVQQAVILEEAVNGYRSEITLSDFSPGNPSLSSVSCRLGWGPKLVLRHHHRPEESHAYFTFAVNGGKNSLRIEITLPGYGLTDCFFGNVCFGNDVDTSRFVNGHSPSKIVRLDEIGADQVWAHDCAWGAEAMDFFRECDETELWRRAKRDAETITALVAPYGTDCRAPVERLRSQAESNPDLVGTARRLRDWFQHAVVRLKVTELFRVCAGVDSKARKLMKDRERTRGNLGKN